jgi:hypothetical protein
MSSERRVAFGVFAIVAILVGGGAFYFFGVVRAKQEKGGARDEALAWEKRWLDARTCLVGDAPLASKPGQALAIREMGPDAERGCTSLMGTLSRGEAPATGLTDVEAAWTEIDKAATKLGSAFGRHVSGTPGAHDPLPDALDAFEERRAALRAAVELPPAEPLGPPLPIAEMIPLVDNGDPVTRLDEPMPSAHGGVTFGNTKSHEVEVVLTAGGAPQIARVGFGAIRSTADLSFGAVAGIDGLKIGALDREGAIKETQTLDLPGKVGLLFVVGTAKQGAALYGVGDKMLLARADGGPFTPGRDMAVASVMANVDPVTNRAAAVWTDPKGDVHGLIAGGAVVDLGKSGDPSAVCLTNERAYAMTRGTLVAFTADKALPSQLVASYQLLSCSPSAAVLYVHGSRGNFQACAESCRTVELGSSTTARAIAAKNKLYAAAAHSGVIEVWREGGKPIFYAAGLDSIHAAMTDGKVMDLVGEAAGQYAIARIPVP